MQLFTEISIRNEILIRKYINKYIIIAGVLITKKNHLLNTFPRR